MTDCAMVKSMSNVGTEERLAANPSTTSATTTNHSSLTQTDTHALHFKVVKHIEMPKACPKKSICHFKKLAMILK